VPVTGIEVAAGVTVNDTDVAALTVNTAVAVWVMPPTVYLAVIVDVPTALPVARPLVTPDMVATPGPPLRSGEVQTEAAVLSMVDPSLNVSIAVYCWVPVTGIEANAGVTLNDTDVTGITEPLTLNIEAFPPPHPAIKTDNNNAMSHMSGLVVLSAVPPVMLSNLFIFFSFYLIQKTIGEADWFLAGS
jgi:hypothetical protein